MTLRLKLTISFLFVSVVTALAVGITARWMVMQDFRQAIEDRAFTHFEEDITRYIKHYGSWETANKTQDFTEFVMQQRPTPPEIDPSIIAAPRPQMMRRLPPFRFLLITPSGDVLRGLDDYPDGSRVSAKILKQGRPIKVNNQLHMYAVPIGNPILSDEDQIYLNYIDNALYIGIGFASVIALMLGLVFGQRLVSNLDRLIIALRQMRPDGEIPTKITITSNDEFGQLAHSFNQMSESLVKCHQDLRELSIRDPLTSLYNRRYFDEQSNNMFKHAKRYDESLCVILIDIDHFKMVNDTFSHSVGDLVLQRTAKLLLKQCRESDLLARFGGEEFILIFANSTFEQAHERCEQLRQKIEAEPWQLIAPDLKVTISLGLRDNTQSDSLSDMIHHADQFLYDAKRNGRNRVEPAA